MNKTIVLKCGGSIIHQLSDSFFHSLQNLKQSNWKIVIVHGGGPDITKMLSSLKISSQFYHGQRKTTKEVLEIAEMVLAGKINKQLTNTLQQHTIKAIGISGSDGELLQGEFLNKEQLGLVGKVTDVNTKLISLLTDNGYIPVIAPLALTATGETLNVNADLAAAAIANNLEAEKLLFVTDVPGILDENGYVIKKISQTEINEHILNGVITGGMIPKVESAISTLSEKLQEVMIVSGKASLLEGEDFIGTKIVRVKEAIIS
ncbi:acetylglutamate kinase [Metabacillus herbersteinensis]|uniref:Acetylglutamate kinase n=1 Tax=Metabacillus herbersteinensis TaxID=283816 RepID=A0ABV6GEK0_9BACI